MSVYEFIRVYTSLYGVYTEFIRSKIIRSLYGRFGFLVLFLTVLVKFIRWGVSLYGVYTVKIIRVYTEFIRCLFLQFW